MKKTIIIAGGGTGGHIYPGVAIARALQKMDSNIEILFVGTREGLETKIIPKEGFPLKLIAGGKLNFAGNPVKKIQTLLKLPLGFFQAIGILLSTKPMAVLGVGGYASGPFLLAAALIGKKTAIWEANAIPGLTNRWLSKFVDRCFLVFEETKLHLKSKNVQVLGMPVRAELEKAHVERPARREGPFHLLHFGGSQGSRAIGRTLCEAIHERGPWTKNLRVVHQTGVIDFKDFQNRYQGYDDVVEMHEFLYDMPKYYQWADLVLCRGGAGTLTEMAAFGLPAIIVPLPAADGHQEKNGELLVKQNAATMILQKDLNAQRLIEEIESLRQHPLKLEEMKKNIKRFHKPQAAEAIAKSLLQN